MRIVGGKFRGQTLVSPKSDAIRPTSDRVRESLFNILAHGDFGLDDDLFYQARVLDLFAGTGALGIEAISRGAASVLFVEDSVEARGLLRQNVENFSLTGNARIFRRDATALGPCQKHGPFSLVFIDPPYAKGLGEKAIISAIEGNWLTPKAICVLEESASANVDIPDSVTLIDERKYGDTVIRILQRNE